MRAAGAALIEQQDVVMLAQRRERWRNLRPVLDRGLAGAAGQEHDEIGVGGFGIGLDQGQVEVDPAAVGRVGILGDLEWRAERRRRRTGTLLRQFATLELQRAERELSCARRHRWQQRARRQIAGSLPQLAVTDVGQERECQNDTEEIAFRHRVFLAQGRTGRSGIQREEMYFSRRMCGTGRPASFSSVNAWSTMFGLPHR